MTPALPSSAVLVIPARDETSGRSGNLMNSSEVERRVAVSAGVNSASKDTMTKKSLVAPAVSEREEDLSESPAREEFGKE